MTLLSDELALDMAQYELEQMVCYSLSTFALPVVVFGRLLELPVVVARMLELLVVVPRLLELAAALRFGGHVLVALLVHF